MWNPFSSLEAKVQKILAPYEARLAALEKAVADYQAIIKGVSAASTVVKDTVSAVDALKK